MRLPSGGPTWEGLGIPSAILPSPPPFLPVPRGIIRGMEGLKGWRVRVLRSPNIMEEVGMVYASSKREAEEAAMNAYEGPGILAVEVMRA